MDGLSQAVGNGISGLVGGSLRAIGAALDGTVAALASALPAGAPPVVGIAAALLVAWLVFRR